MMQANNMLPDGQHAGRDRGCGARLRKAREAAGLTQADVAEPA